MRYTGPRNRLAKREGQNLFLKNSAKFDTAKKPGMHQKRFGQLSEYGVQLREKQKAKRIFGITERVCVKCYKEAVRRKGITGVNFLTLLETRLDNVIYRAGWALTRAQARQMVNHRVFQVNGRRADIASLNVRAGDVITVREKFASHPVLVQMEAEKIEPVKWLEVDFRKKQITVARLPEEDEMEQSIALHRIIEFYSR